MEGATKLMLAGMVSILAFIGIRASLNWEQERHPPLPPHATQVGELLTTSDELLTTGGLRQTTYRVPTTVADVRRFYQQALSQRGWRYCGTQTTPHCTNMQQLSAALPQVDVYRLAGDRDGTGATIEIWASWDANNRQTVVTVAETAPRR